MPTADMLAIKFLIISIISTQGAEFMMLDIQNFLPQHTTEEVQILETETDGPTR